MKVVIETNVFISSFLGGKPRQIIDLWKIGKITLCLSPAIIEEYIEALRRLGLSQEEEIKELMDLFAGGFNIAFISKTPKLKVVKKDPGDDKFIECAVALKAEAVITGDKHLRSIRNYMGINIITPTEYLKSFCS